ncbi:PREDICTED: developmental pluripotency-associated 5 protein-like [Cercocebus atys]|uniref:developmental pluripotency-associated 5 protein-like n=1 Tax=Cercocebus atys TaxID=9531 RepID=UPI0005F5124D|nr:PREDICTED: developmental pluripotency-associated 5 protein-like [Cercocebus atys]
MCNSEVHSFGEMSVISLKGNVGLQELLVSWKHTSNQLPPPPGGRAVSNSLEAGEGGIPYTELVSKAMLELKALESSDLTEVVVYGYYLYKLQTKWMLQSMPEWNHQRQE